ncbi:uncharacterized protein [Nicotiana tomentosiformis]|uniref:uncharacterized protein n=1 Tax=Nicotiana tomentosiformis TaxID=4098 RepID=UPI00388CC70C
MVTAQAATLPTQPARGGGQASGGHPRGGGQARYYALSARTEEVASDSFITSIVPVYHRDALVLFDPGSTYSYVSSYFAPYLGVSHDSLSSPVYVSTPVGDSLAQRTVEKGCDTYLAYVRDVSVNTPTVESVPVVRDYIDVFSADLLGMPPDRDIDFGYYRRFVEGFSSIAAPMNRLTQKGAPFRWTESSLHDFIKERQFDDPHLLVLKNTVQYSDVKEVTIGDNGALRMQGRLYVPNVDGFHELILQEAHSLRYFIHPGVAKMYHDLRQHYLWRRMKKDIVDYVAQFLNCQQVKYEHQRPGGLLQKLEITKLALPPSLAALHPVFHVSILRKYDGDPSHVLDFSSVQLDKDLSYIEELVDILDWQVRKFSSENIALVKWMTRMKEIIHLMFADIRLREECGEVNIAVLEQWSPISTLTQQFLGLEQGSRLPSNKDVNSMPSDDELSDTIDGADD